MSNLVDIDCRLQTEERLKQECEEYSLDIDVSDTEKNVFKTSASGNIVLYATQVANFVSKVQQGLVPTDESRQKLLQSVLQLQPWDNVLLPDDHPCRKAALTLQQEYKDALAAAKQSEVVQSGIICPTCQKPFVRKFLQAPPSKDEAPICIFKCGKCSAEWEDD